MMVVTWTSAKWKKGHSVKSIFSQKYNLETLKISPSLSLPTTRLGYYWTVAGIIITTSQLIYFPFCLSIIHSSERLILLKCESDYTTSHIKKFFIWSKWIFIQRYQDNSMKERIIFSTNDAGISGHPHAKKWI